MRFTIMIVLYIALVAMAVNAQMETKTTTQYDDILGEGLGWMNIVSPEHTGEYLAKTGGATGSATTYTPIDLRGNWSFELRTLDEKLLGKANLNLAQMGTIVFGSGRVGVSDNIVTANGALIDNKLTLNIMTYPNVELYVARLDISRNGNSASGYFEAYSSTGGRIQGKISGRKDVPRTLS